MDDLISEGIIGLLDAIDRFNPERGADFTTYATIRIRGAIIDYLRQEDLIPRKVRDYLREIENARVQLEVEKKRTPTQEEIAERLGITLKKLSHYMKKVRTAEMVSLDELRRLSRFREAKATPLFRREDAELCAELEKNERIAILRNACRNLKPRERLILALYYIEELPLKHMQHILGISMARISQINKRVLSTLRSALEDRKEILIS
jgi:RNA polymerase sigma factor for flagellar operon FliA